MQRPKLVTISGPTAVGKTSFAVALAKQLGCPILSSDARQFYKEMQVGTAVPSTEEQQGVPHYFIQHKSIHEPYTVGDFERDAIKLLEDLFKKHDVVILVGGSNLYTDAVVNGLDVFPEVPEEIKHHWQQAFEQKGIEFLQNEIQRLDPSYHSSVDLQNHVRLLRALGVCTASGKPYSSFLGQPKRARNFDVVSIEITISREKLYSRINSRVDIMIAKGLVEEVQRLLSHKNLNALQTVGYRELFPYLEEKLPLEACIENIKKNTRRFAKRQLTWLRNHPCEYQIPNNTLVDDALLKKLGLKKLV
jgi:tRNA dimethylallyltransferase